MYWHSYMERKLFTKEMTSYQISLQFLVSWCHQREVCSKSLWYNNSCTTQLIKLEKNYSTGVIVKNS